MLSEAIEAWKDGKYSEAVGVFLGQNVDLVLGAGLLGKGGRAGRLGRAAEVLDTASEAEKTLGAVGRTGERVADTAAEVTRGLRAEVRAAAEAATDVRPARGAASSGLEGTPSAGAAGTIAPNSLEQAYANLVNSDRPWSWAADFPDGASLTVGQRRGIRAEAIRRGLVTEVPFKPGTRFPDFAAAGMVRRIDRLPTELWKLSDDVQFRWLDSRVPGGRPPGTTWHHSEIPGRMELVPFGAHNVMNHMGGRSPGMWAYPRVRSGA